MINLSSLRFSRLIAACLVMLLAAPLEYAAQAQQPQLPQQPAPVTQPTPAQANSTRASVELPEAPAPAPTGAQSSSQDANPASTQEPQLSARDSTPAQQQTDAQNPVGTAAAPVARPTGVAGSRPAGAVIAPGKQRRVHAFLIRMGIVVGAAAAVGTVVALSKGSPSRPQ